MGCGASTPAPASDGAPEKPPAPKAAADDAAPAQKADAAPAKKADSAPSGTDEKKGEPDGAKGADGRRKTMTVRRQAVSAELPSDADDAGPVAEPVPKSEEEAKALTAALAAHPLFEFLAKPLQAKLTEVMSKTDGAAGADIIVKGEPGDHLYIVYTGEYEAYDKATNEVFQPYNVGDGFGELALLYNSPRAASVRCKTAGVLFALDRKTFRKEVMTHNAGVKMGLERFLQNVPDLQGLEESQMAQLANVMDASDWNDGEYIVQKGDQAESLFLILSGEVVCHSEGGGQDEMRLKEGEFFGESALKEAAEDRKRQANVVAVGSVRVGELKREDFKQILGSLEEVFVKNFNRKVLDGVDLLKPLQVTEREALLDIFEVAILEEGATAIEQGTVGTHFFIIKSGAMSVQNDGAEVKQLKDGDYFGERSLLTAEATNATVKALGRTELMKLGKEEFDKALGPLANILEKARMERDREIEREKKPKMRWDDLQMISMLGEGSFGRVKLMLHKPDKTPYALKCLHKGQLVRYQQVEHVVNEKRVLQACDHPFILRMVATFNGKSEIYMMLEVAMGGELFTQLRIVGRFDETSSCLYAAMVTSAFAYLHARRIAHRDLKPENLLFDRDGYLKLVDFGFAKVIKDRTWTLCGTPEYLAPEIISNKGHNVGADWWTLGILIYEMLVGQPPFVADNQIDTYHKIMRGKYKIPQNFPKAAKDMISKLLCHNPAARLGTWKGGAKDVINHEFFTPINWQELESRKVAVPYVPTIKDPLDTSNFDNCPISNDAAQWERYNDQNYEHIWQAEFGGAATSTS